MSGTLSWMSFWYKAKRGWRGFSCPYCAFWVSLVLVIGVDAGLFKLAYWQYTRMGEKEAARTQLLARQHETALWPAQLDDIGKKISLSGTFTGQSFLWEHQKHGPADRMHVGWRVLSPFVLEGGQHIIIDRGWTPYATGNGRIQPDISRFEPPEGQITLMGILRQLPQRKTGSWGGPVTTTHPHVLAFPDAEYMLNKKGEKSPAASPTLYMESLTATSPHIAAVARPLPEPGRHQEYMLTWLGLALALPLLYIGAVVSRISRRKKPA